LGGGEVAGVGEGGEVFEKGFALVFGENGEDFSLKIQGDLAGGVVSAAAAGEEADAAGAAVGLVGGALKEAAGFHAFEEGGNGVGVAGDNVGDLPLGELEGGGLDEGAEDGKLVGGEAGGEEAAAEGLVEAVPGAAEEGGEAAAGGRVEGEGAIFDGVIHVLAICG